MMREQKEGLGGLRAHIWKHGCGSTERCMAFEGLEVLELGESKQCGVGGWRELDLAAAAAHRDP